MTIDFLSSIDYYKNYVQEVELFHQFFMDTDPADCCFYLLMRSQAEKELQI